MSLKGLKKSDDEHKQQDIEDFINGASKRVKTLETEQSQQKYRRLTFSLTSDIDQDIDELMVNCKVARANRSIIVKAAIKQLKLLSDHELHTIVLEEIR